MTLIVPEWVQAILPSMSVIVLVVLALAVMRWSFDHNRSGAPSKGLLRQGMVFLLFFIGSLAFVISLPIEDSTRGQLLSLIGLLVTAAIALSSTTFVGNMMAGLLMRALGSFKIGDFIRSEEHFGRVSEIGLLHTEVQTEDRDLVTLPNLFIVTHPLRVVHSTGTVVSADLSLGYDVAHLDAENALLRAAAAAGLKEPFVQIVKLGDYSVSYRVAGILTEVKQLMTARSRLKASVLDNLHGSGIEIVSPLFQTQRVFPAEKVFIPEGAGAEAAMINGEEIFPEDHIFDKADKAESLEKLRSAFDIIEAKIDELEAQIKGPGKNDPSVEKRLARARSLKGRLATRIESR